MTRSKTPILIIVDGISTVGKTSIIGNARRGIEAAGFKVHVQTFKAAKDHVIGKTRSDYMIKQAMDFDAQIEQLGRDGHHVIICDGHPFISEPIVNTHIKLDSSSLWHHVKKPDFVMILSSTATVIYQHQDSKPNPMSFKDIIRQLDKYSQLSSADVGSTNIMRITVADYDNYLYAAGDLRAMARKLLDSKGVAAA